MIRWVEKFHAWSRQDLVLNNNILSDINHTNKDVNNKSLKKIHVLLVLRFFTDNFAISYLPNLFMLIYFQQILKNLIYANNQNSTIKHINLIFSRSIVIGIWNVIMS